MFFSLSLIQELVFSHNATQGNYLGKKKKKKRKGKEKKGKKGNEGCLTMMILTDQWNCEIDENPQR